MRISEILVEFKENELYHYMPIEKAKDVFSLNMMPARFQKTLSRPPGRTPTGRNKSNAKTYAGNSFSRNPRFQWSGHAAVRITVDQDKLRQTNRMFAWDQMMHGYRKGTQEIDKRFEEYVLGDIKHLNRCIKSIELIVPNRMSLESPSAGGKSFGEVLYELYHVCQIYSQRWNVPFTSTIPLSKLPVPRDIEKLKATPDTLDWNLGDENGPERDEFGALIRPKKR